MAAVLSRRWEQSINKTGLTPERHERFDTLGRRSETMRTTVLTAIVTGLFLVSASSLWAGHLPGAPEGWAATPKLHIKGQGPVKNIRPNYITGYGYSPSQIKAAYGISGNGAGQTIAIVDAYGSATIKEDLATFCQAFGLPQATLTIYLPGGPLTSSDADWAMETSLDVEWVHALAPLATIALVIAPTDSASDLLNAVQFAAQNVGAHVVSMSWGGPEFDDETSFDSYLPKRRNGIHCCERGLRVRGPVPGSLPECSGCGGHGPLPSTRDRNAQVP